MQLQGKTLEIFQGCRLESMGDIWWVDGIPTGMEREDYNRFQNTLGQLRGQWSRKHQKHIFEFDAREIWAKAIATQALPPINPYAFFPTPEVLIALMLEWSGLPFESPNETHILEPSAGDGRIAKAIRKHLPTAIIDCVELDPTNQEILSAQEFNLVGDNFESFKPDRLYHYILMNPPFQKDKYIKHVQRAFDMLMPNGVLMAVVPTSYRYKPSVRNWIFERGDAEWMGSGLFERTNVDTSVVKLERYDTSRFWQQWNGYPSAYAEAVDTALSCDRSFVAQVEANNLTQTTIDHAVQRLVKDGANLLYDGRVQIMMGQIYADHFRKQAPYSVTEMPTLVAENLNVALAQQLSLF
jgi:hypothetical protein